MAHTSETTLDGGVVIEFPLDRVRPADEHVNNKPTCMDCSNVYAGVRGLFCGYFNETIIYEEVAEECSEFDPL